jgi:plasmid stabilization system protein ParE
VRHELLKRARFLDDYRKIILRIADVNVLAADRFCDAIESALDLIAAHPEIGPTASFPKAPEVRFWPLRRYPDYLIFYRVERNSVILLRLLSGRRDLPPLIPPG